MKLICAPMATLSHAAFRILIEKFGGCDEHYTEMINAPTLLCGSQFENFYLNPAPVPEKIVWQLTGKNVSSIVEASSIMCECGGIGIDLNMGCCAPDIVKSGAGIAWMTGKPISETESLVKGVKNALLEYEKKSYIHRRLSCKIRLGNESWNDDSLFSFCDMLEANGVERITLHPRTQKEKYRDKPRLEYGEKLAKRYANGGPSIVINGDIDSVEKAKKAIQTCPSCEGIMIGRAAVQKPWIFSLIKSSMDFEAKTLEKNESDKSAECQSFLEYQLMQCHQPCIQTMAEDVAISGNQAAVNLELKDTLMLRDGLTYQTKPTDLLKLATDFVDDIIHYQPQEFWRTRIQRFFTYFCDNLSFAHYAKTLLLNYKSIEDTKEKLTEYFTKVPGDRIKCLK